jgi:hypothetical protein
MRGLCEVKLEIVLEVMLINAIQPVVENACGQSGSVAVRPRF